jgi:hypothetical protein
MSFEEEFDKIMSQKMEEASFPFDEKNWQKASALLDAEKGAVAVKGFKKFYLPGIAVLLLGTASIVTFNLLSTSPDKKEVALTPAEATAISPSNNETTALAHPIQKNKTTSITQTNQSTQQNSSVANESNLNSAEVYQASNASNSQLQITKQTHTSRKHNPNSSATNSPLDAQNVSASATDVPEKVVSAIDTKAPETNAENEKPTSAEPTNNNFVTENKPTLTDTPPLLTPPVAEVISANASALSSENNAIYLNPLKTSFLFDRNEDLLFTPFTLLPRYGDDYYKKHDKLCHFLNIEAGGTYLLGWQTPSGTDGKGINYFAGCNYGIYITSKLSFGLGVQVYNISHINDPFSKTTKVEYGFGSKTTNTLITTNALYYAALPIKLYYAINQSNQIGLGVNMSYLFNSKSTIDSYSVSPEGGKQNSKKETKTGIYDGLNTTNMMLSAFYKMNINKRLALNGEFMYGVSDIFMNAKTINKNAEVPMGARLSLQYTLFNK